MSAGRPRDGGMQLVTAVDKQTAALPPRPPSTASSAIVTYEKPLLQEDEEDLEIKLRRIIDNVPVRVSNTSGSSAGSGSGDFHQVSLYLSGTDKKETLGFTISCTVLLFLSYFDQFCCFLLVSKLN